MWTIKYVDKRVEMTKGAVLDDKRHRAGKNVGLKRSYSSR